LPLRAATSKWDDLAYLKPDQLIRIELRDAKLYEGAFEAVDDKGITLRRASGEQTFAREDVVRIYTKGKNHRVRNTIIGGTIGALFFGLPIDLANRRNGWWHSAAWAWWTCVPAWAGLGVAIPTGGWSKVYQAPKQRADREKTKH
jgi:hypothetical protein